MNKIQCNGYNFNNQIQIYALRKKTFKLLEEQLTKSTCLFT